jgi:nucleolar protein 15
MSVSIVCKYYKPHLIFVTVQVAPIVAEAMHNYLLFESMLQVKVVPLEKLKPSMWVGANKPFRIIDWQKLERERHNRVSERNERSCLWLALQL